MRNASFLQRFVSRTLQACENRRRRTRRRWFAPPMTRFALAAATILVCAASQAQGSSYSWSVQSGDWLTATNWGGTTPGTADTAYIINGGTAAITLPGAACNTLYLGDPNSTNSGTIQMSGGSLSVSWDEFLGNKGLGTLFQSGGTNNLSGGVNTGLYLGYDTSSSGSYNISGSGVLSASNEYVGSSGTGTFSQSGGTNIISYGLYLGRYSGSSGTYNAKRRRRLSAGERERGLQSGCAGIIPADRRDQQHIIPFHRQQRMVLARRRHAANRSQWRPRNFGNA